jgi:hypothetical protein|tara:strand:+ start:782 stop:1243 length:462 start_codon:yes stop_codon:yes gene_type:complete
MLFAKRILFVIILFSTLIGKSGNISTFHVQLELTPEATVFVASLPDEEKQNWLELIPDSIPLKATCVLKYTNQPSNKLGFKLGSIDGLGDIFEGSFDFTSTTNSIQHSQSGEIHYFQLGNIKHYKSFTALAWFSGENGAPLEMVRFVKKGNNQ